MIKLNDFDEMLNKLYAAFETAEKELEDALATIDRKDEEIQQLKERIDELEANA